MTIKRDASIILSALFIAALAMSSCVKNRLGPNDAQTPNTETFSTKQIVSATISYSNSNGKVLFHVYDRNPLDGNGNFGAANANIPALDAAYTNDQGVYSGNLHLPAYVTDVYIVANTPNGQRLMTGTISNGTLTIRDTDENNAVAFTKATKARGHTSSVFTAGRFASLGWLDKLGTYNSTSGRPDYTNDPSISLVSTTERSTLVNIANSTLAIDQTLGDIYRTQEDLLTAGDNTEITLMVIMGNTCWNNALGYYYYEDGHQPASLAECKVYTLIPNTQVKWTQPGYIRNPLLSSPQSLYIGDKVQLKYFGPDGNSIGTTKFPKGIRIGFVLANNMWDYHFTGYYDYFDTTGTPFYACSTPATSGFSNNTEGTKLKTHTAYFRDETYPHDIIMGFEDYKDDENFEDIVFAITSNPAIVNVPVVNSPGTLASLQRYGFYAFEDLWPKTGDFDMNDVMAEYVYTKTFNYSNYITKEQFSFTLYPNSKTTLKNGIGFIFNTLPSGATISVTKDGTAVAKNTEESGRVVLLTDDVAGSIGSAASTTYVVTVDYGMFSTKTVSDETSINTFIYRTSANDASKRWELHTPMSAPTSFMDYSYFGTQQDCSVPASGIYYVLGSDIHYPFAFYLENATVADMANLLDINKSETKQISLLFPYFSAWAADNSVHKDWYKSTISN